MKREAGSVRIIAGLGNPGPAYCDTRHNAGWMGLDKVAGRRGVSREECRCGGLLAHCGDLRLFKPLSYVNDCGLPVARLCAETGVGVEDLLVLVDDLNLPLGSVRLRSRGSSGGHKGLIALIEALGTEEFSRLRMGIGPCPTELGARDFVLSPFDAEEWDLVEAMTDLAAEAALCWAEEGMEAAMNRFNRRTESDASPE